MLSQEHENRDLSGTRYTLPRRQERSVRRKRTSRAKLTFPIGPVRPGSVSEEDHKSALYPAGLTRDTDGCSGLISQSDLYQRRRAHIFALLDRESTAVRPSHIA